jgi:hypothetical protein
MKPTQPPKIKLLSAYTAQVVAVVALLGLATQLPSLIHRTGYSLANGEQFWRFLFESPLAYKVLLLSFVQIIFGLILLHGLRYWRLRAGKISTLLMVASVCIVPFIAPLPDPATLPASQFSSGYQATEDKEAALGATWLSKDSSSRATSLDSLGNLIDAVPGFMYCSGYNTYDEELGAPILLSDDLYTWDAVKSERLVGIDTIYNPFRYYSVYSEIELHPFEKADTSSRASKRKQRMKLSASQLTIQTDSASGDTIGWTMPPPYLDYSFFSAKETAELSPLFTKLKVLSAKQNRESRQLWLAIYDGDTLEYGYVRVQSPDVDPCTDEFTESNYSYTRGKVTSQKLSFRRMSNTQQPWFRYHIIYTRERAAKSN